MLDLSLKRVYFFTKADFVAISGSKNDRNKTVF